VASSRIHLAAVLALVAAPAGAQPEPADPVEAQREVVRAAVSDECGGTDEEEIVVCGRRAEEARTRRYRVEPSAAYSGPRDTAGGAQRHAMAANDDPCSPVGTIQRCGGGLDVPSVVFGAVRIVRALRARRD